MPSSSRLIALFYFLFSLILQSSSISRRSYLRSGDTRPSLRTLSHNQLRTHTSVAVSRIDSPLALPCDKLKGVGYVTKAALAQLNIHCVADLLLHIPTALVNRTRISTLSESSLDEIVMIEVTVDRVIEGWHGSPYRVLCTDDAREQVQLVFFFGTAGGQAKIWLPYKNILKPGTRILTSGKLTMNKYNNKLQIANPSFPLDASQGRNLEGNLGHVPIYSLTTGLKAKKLQQMIEEAFQLAETSELYQRDWMPEAYRKSKGWPTIREALIRAHNPESSECILPSSSWIQRLAFDELVVRQMDAIVSRKPLPETSNEASVTVQQRSHKSYVVEGDDVLMSFLEKDLPFSLTNCQRNAVREIVADLAADRRMVRCVQGDVGSGKTLVTIMAMLRAVEAGKQGAILAPTEILAKQHFSTVQGYFDLVTRRLRGWEMDGSSVLPEKYKSKELVVRLITGSVKGKVRDELLEDLRAGRVDVIVGTHALFTPQVMESFYDLGLVCIDEEQRFGVTQRDALADRSNVMFTTATPIPRSLTLFVQNQGYSISTLIEKPPKKRPIKTFVRPMSLTLEIIERLKKHIPNGTKIFWVTPCKEPTASMPGCSVKERFEQLSSLVPGRVGMLHGSMPAEEKEEVMNRFAQPDGELSILVSTTVVEVGVDVPDASICIIDQAENFGLAQIHQIRGRIGRGEKPPRETLEECICMLIYNDKMNIVADEDAALHARRQKAIEKLNVLERTNDGFEVAEHDLNLRGPGDIFGMKQHGNVKYKVASLMHHAPLLTEAHRIAASLLEGTFGTLTDAVGVQFAVDPALIRELQSIYLGKVGSFELSPLCSDGAASDAPSVEFPGRGRRKRARSTKVDSRSYVDFERDDLIILAIDLETTGMNPRNARVVHLG